MAEETQYRVKADLTLDATKAKAQAVQMQAKIQQLGRRIAGTSTLAGGLTRNLIAIGGAYLGINALVRGFSSLTRGAVQYASELEKIQIGLTAVLTAVQGTDWNTAAQTSGRIFEQVRQDSIKSVATAQELFRIYQGIVGPILGAGKGLEVVRTITRDTVNAAGVLGVDLAQAQRDVNMMARGTAGMEVKLFSMLRSTGAIVESTEEWNKGLTGGERVEKLQAALAKFAKSGDKFAKSFAGTTSTFRGIRQEFTRSAFQPVMDAMAGSLFRINSILIENQEIIQKRLRAWGEQTAQRLTRIFKIAENGVMMLATRWDEVLAKMERIGQMMRNLGMLGAGAMAAQVVGRPALGAAVGLGGTLAGAAGATTAGAGAVAMGASFGIAAAAAGLLASGVLVLSEQWEHFKLIFDAWKPILAGLGTDVVMIAKLMWETLAPALKVVGHIIGAVVTVGLLMLIKELRVLAHWTVRVMVVMKNISTAIYDFAVPAFNELWMVIEKFATLLGFSVNKITKDYEKLQKVGQVDPLDALRKQMGDISQPFDRYRTTSTTPPGRQTVVNDFRGSKIQVKQEFRDQDPDRVLVAMAQGISRQAEMRIQSGMLPALGR